MGRPVSYDDFPQGLAVPADDLPGKATNSKLDLPRLAEEKVSARPEGIVEAIKQFGLGAINAGSESAQAILHNVQKPLHGIANTIEQGAAGAAGLIAPGSGAAKRLKDIASEDDQAAKRWEAEYQQRVPNTIPAYVGATIGAVGPWMGGAPAKAMAKIGEVAGNVVPKFIAKGFGGQAIKGVVGGAAQGASMAPFALNTSNKDYGQHLADSALLGMIGGGVAPPVFGVAGYGLGTAGNFIKGLYQTAGATFGHDGANLAAGRIALQAAEDKSPEIIGLLNKGKAMETAAETALPAQVAPFSALQKFADSTLPSKAVERDKTRELLRQSRLERITPDMGKAEAAVKDTIPTMKAELLAANIGGYKAKQKAQLEGSAAHLRDEAGRNTEDVRRLSKAGQIAEDAGHSGRMRLDSGAPPVAGLPRIPERYSYGSELSMLADEKASQAAEKSLQSGKAARVAQGQADAIDSSKSLKIETVTDGINRMIKHPSIGAVTENVKALESVRDRLIFMAEQNGGIIDSRALHAIREYEIGDKIGRLAKESNTATKNRIAGTLIDVKGIMDNAMESAGANGWKDWLKDYEGKKRVVDQSKILNKAQEVLSGQGGPERKAPFMNVLGRGEDSLIKKETGWAKYGGLEDVLTPRQHSTMKLTEREFNRDLDLKRLQVAGLPKASSIARQTIHGNDLPYIPDKTSLIARSVMSFIEGKGGAKTDEALAELMQPGNQRALAEYMKQADPYITRKIAKAWQAAKNRSLPAVSGGLLGQEFGKNTNQQGRQ